MRYLSCIILLQLTISCNGPKKADTKVAAEPNETATEAEVGTEAAHQPTDPAYSSEALEVLKDLPLVVRLACADEPERFALYLQNQDHPRKEDFKHLLPEPGYSSVTYKPKAAWFQFEFDGSYFETWTYWNLADGSKLVGREERGCGPGCSSTLTFWRHAKDGVIKLELLDVIPQYDALPSVIDPQLEHFEADMVFDLPNIGKNIQFCADGTNCIELEFEDGVFMAQE